MNSDEKIGNYYICHNCNKIIPHGKIHFCEKPIKNYEIKDEKAYDKFIKKLKKHIL